MTRVLRNQGKPPVRYAEAVTVPGWGNWDYNDTREADVQAMQRLGDVFGIVDLLATAVSRVEWRMYRKPEPADRARFASADEGSDEREEVLDHPALNLINNPCPWVPHMNGKFFRRAVQQHRELTGEGYLLIERGNLKGQRVSLPIGLWYARPDRVDPVPSVDNFIAGYVYTGPDGVAEPLRLDEVIPILSPNPYDMYHGLGPVQSVLTDIDSARYTSEWNRNFFLNGAPAGGVFQFDRNLTDREWEEFVNRWRESHQGVMRAHRLAVIEGGTWTPEATVVKDMDFANLRQCTSDVIRRAWRIHKHMMGESDTVNLANAETAEETFTRWQVVDRLEDWKLAYNGRLLPMYGPAGRGVEVDYVDPVPQNREANMLELTGKATAAATLADAGWDPGDVLVTCGLPPMKFTGVAAANVPALPSEPGGPIPRYPEHEPDEATDPDIIARLRPFTARALPSRSLNGVR
jgi:HK97 family phage portal protein